MQFRTVPQAVLVMEMTFYADPTWGELVVMSVGDVARTHTALIRAGVPRCKPCSCHGALIGEWPGCTDREERIRSC
jgi:hypothetical protein